MNHQETIAALAIHGRRERAEAETQRGLAASARADARVYASQHLGEAMAEKRAQIIAEGERAAAEAQGRANRHDERADTAEAGYMLLGDPELRDPGYAMGHQPLISAAHKHGIVKGTAIRPSTGVMGNAPIGQLNGPKASQG